MIARRKIFSQQGPALAQVASANQFQVVAGAKNDGIVIIISPFARSPSFPSRRASCILPEVSRKAAVRLAHLGFAEAIRYTVIPDSQQFNRT